MHMRQQHLKSALAAPELMGSTVDSPSLRPYDARLRRTLAVRFDNADRIEVVERLAYIDIVGDIRDASNPNYGAIGVARSMRLAAFAEEFAFTAHELTDRCFATWKRM